MGLAQLVRASGCGPEGRGFESHNSPHVVAGYDSSRRFFFQIPLGCYIASEFVKGLPFAALILEGSSILLCIASQLGVLMKFFHSDVFQLMLFAS